MFDVPSFETIVYPITLQFKLKSLETYYKNNQVKNYFHRISSFYSIMIVLIIFILTTSIQIQRLFKREEKVVAYGQLISISALIAGILIELLVNVVPYLRVMRGVPLAIFSSISGTIYNCAFEQKLAIRFE